MKKTLEKIVSVVLVGAMALSLTGCNVKKQVDPDDFEKKMEKAGFIVEEDEDEDAEESRIAYYLGEEEDSEEFVLVTYYLFKSNSDAKGCFDASYDDLKKEKDKGFLDGTTSKGSWKFTGEGEFSEDSALGEGEYYVVGIVAQKMVIIAYSASDKASRKALDKALSELGYD